MRPSRGLAFLFLATVCFGTAEPAIKAVMDVGLSPGEVVQLRGNGAALVLLAMAFVRDPKSLRVAPRELPLLLAYGLFAFLGIQEFSFVALSRLPVGVALLLEYLAIVFVALWARFVQGRVLAPMTWAGIACAVAGLAMSEQVWRGAMLDGVGAAAGIASAICLAAYFLLSEHGIGGRDPISLAALGSSIGAIAADGIAPPWRLPFARLRDIAHLGPLAVPAWMALSYVVLIGTVGAYVSDISALNDLPSPVAGVLSTFEVVVAAATAWWLLGETLSGMQLAGAAVLFAGVVLAQMGSRAAPPARALGSCSEADPR
ncbi:DMT family transporter [Pendulispora albinea]|uniref:DMT family transporter n=1 Tax=Pendulispora albinea TaxID=2741071 RepID=A0ABZ2LS98_9BACT